MTHYALGSLREIERLKSHALHLPSSLWLSELRESPGTRFCLSSLSWALNLNFLLLGYLWTFMVTVLFLFDFCRRSFSHFNSLNPPNMGIRLLRLFSTVFFFSCMLLSFSMCSRNRRWCNPGFFMEDCRWEMLESSEPESAFLERCLLVRSVNCSLLLVLE